MEDKRAFYKEELKKMFEEATVAFDFGDSTFMVFTAAYKLKVSMNLYPLITIEEYRGSIDELVKNALNRASEPCVITLGREAQYYHESFQWLFGSLKEHHLHLRNPMNGRLFEVVYCEDYEGRTKNPPIDTPLIKLHWKNNSWFVVVTTIKPFAYEDDESNRDKNKRYVYRDSDWVPRTQENRIRLKEKNTNELFSYIQSGISRQIQWNAALKKGVERNQPMTIHHLRNSKFFWTLSFDRKKVSNPCIEVSVIWLPLFDERRHVILVSLGIRSGTVTSNEYSIEQLEPDETSLKNTEELLLKELVRQKQYCRLYKRLT